MIRFNNYILNRSLSILLIIQIILIGWASRHPHWIEKFYSNGIYPEISGFLRRLLGWIPISVGDIIYTFVFIALLGWVWYLYETRFSPFMEHIYKIGAFISVVFFLFHILWGLNYYRLPLYQQMGVKTLQYDMAALTKTTQNHINNINRIHSMLSSNDSLTPETTFSKQKMYQLSAAQYKNLNYKNLKLNFRFRSAKGSLYSLPLSYMGFSGYLNPFTGESQINRKIPITSYPITLAHEMAHQLGYASETEANFIGYFACKSHNEPFFQYSGELMAVRFLIAEVAKYNPELAKTYYQSLHYGIQKNIEQNQDFWDSYKTRIKPTSQKIYDYFLKANAQTKGIKSYNAMVAYLIAEN